MPVGDEMTLLEAWRAGDAKAGNELIARQFPRIKRFFSRKTSNRDTIQELMQRTFARCVKKLPAFEGRSSFDTFIYGIARHVLLEHYREQRRSERHVEVEQMPMADLDEVFSADNVEQAEDRKLLINALRRLPVDTQILVELYFFEDFKGPVVCEILGLSETKFRGRIRSARKKLQHEIEQLTSSPELLESTQMTLITWARKVRGQIDLE